MPEPIQVDQEAIKAEIAKLSPDAMQAELLKLQTRKKKQQLKHQGSDQQKKYQAKQREKFKLMKEQALASPSDKTNPETGRPFANKWEEINFTASKQAETEVENETEPEGEEVEA